jgi:hypothetical protein
MLPMIRQMDKAVAKGMHPAIVTLIKMIDALDYSQFLTKVSQTMA